MSKIVAKDIGFCPDCRAEIRFRKAPHLGQVVSCTKCEATLEVVRRSPIELDWVFAGPYEEDEDDYDDDWDDDDDDYDDYDDDDDDDSDWDDDDF